MKNLLIPLLCSWTLLLYSCKQDPEPQLPPETQTGANTFGCIVNGKLWLPFQEDGSPAINAYLGSSGTFALAAFLEVGKTNTGGKISNSIALGLKGLNKIGIYYLDERNTYIDYANKQIKCYYLCYNKPSFYYTGKIEITRFDLGNNIVSGKFEATLKVPDCDTIKITNGRFDVKPL